jgi:hypothetical protein
MHIRYFIFLFFSILLFSCNWDKSTETLLTNNSQKYWDCYYFYSDSSDFVKIHSNGCLRFSKLGFCQDYLYFPNGDRWIPDYGYRQNLWRLESDTLYVQNWAEIITKISNDTIYLKDFKGDKCFFMIPSLNQKVEDTIYRQKIGGID